MGFLSDIVEGIGDVLGDIVDGVVDFVDDVIGIDLKKILQNDWVKYGLMAASLFTGGVAIVNGVVQGAGAAASAKGFMASFVEGAKGFVQGAASGIVNPLKTAGNLGSDISNLAAGDFGALTGRAGDLAKSAAQTAGENVIAQTPTDLLSEGATQSFADAGLDAVQPDFVTGAEALSDSAVDDLLGTAQPTFGDPVSSSLPGLDSPVAEAAAGAAPGAAPSAVPSVTPGGAEEKGFFGRMKDAATDFAASPAGMRTLAGAAQGWAQGQAREEELKRLERRERRRRDSWSGFGDRANSILSGEPMSLRQLRERRMQTMNRGNQAQAKYG